uniref:Uncharacterized protein n=1 Tax=Romanomermis culicivorax TaxID=13658 RepID=A0A915KAN8_ROMCU
MELGQRSHTADAYQMIAIVTIGNEFLLSMCPCLTSQVQDLKEESDTEKAQNIKNNIRLKVKIACSGYFVAGVFLQTLSVGDILHGDILFEDAKNEILKRMKTMNEAALSHAQLLCCRYN